MQVMNRMSTLPKVASQRTSVVAKATRSTGKPKLARPAQDDALWLPNTERPEWLDGTLPGDRGFDPLGLSKPNDFVQIGVDEEDQNQAKNRKGDVEAIFRPDTDSIDGQNKLAPYSEVFGLARFRETEVIHGRWAMLGTLGALVGEGATGVSWVDAGKVELDGAQYLGQSLPFSITQLIWIEAILVGGVEILRNNELDLEKRIYPGGAFDPLNLADEEDEEKAFRLKTAEIKHGRLAMIAFLGFGIQAAVTGEGALGSLAKFASTL
uniref:Chlorophyll a-b binding protein, chloroplastic n=1 Tax=Dunaliella tertiolecta TaxID=3047 RepID=A0A7S3R4T8_DUNTE|mmetsp:Transcript_14312/g.38822  ORF Transcript_14312/g.38822 Transcript_14312/m.38822 type:complete len:266 (+) Transcript_14312:63-860(+)